MKFKEVATSNASTEAKVAALALLLDKELIKLADTVLNVKKLEGPKGEQGIQGPKGEQGDRGFDGTNGKDGADGKDGKDGEDGKQGVGVADAKIDFDGSLVITLTDGTEINAGDVVPLDTAEKIRVIGNGGGTSQSVLDAIDAINAIISTYGTMALQDDTAVDINGGAIDGTAIGASSASTGKFTTLTATGDSLLGLNGSNNQTFRATAGTGAFPWVQTSHASGEARIRAAADSGAVTFSLSSLGSATVRFYTDAFTNEQLRIARTASAVNYVQVTGAATTGIPVISSQGSDTNIGLTSTSKGTGSLIFRTNNNAQTQFTITHTGSAVNYWQATGAAAGSSPVLSVVGSDTNIDLNLTPKGTGTVVANGPFTATGQTSLGGVTDSESLRVLSVASATRYLTAQGSASGDAVLSASGPSGSNVNLTFYSRGTGSVRFGTNSSITNEQFRVSNTASAVNYVQVTGNATTGAPTLSTQGSDTNISMQYLAKGTGVHAFQTGSSFNQFRITATNSAVNYLAVTGGVAGSAPVMSVAGSDTNIDLALTPKGTGLVRFGTYTAGAPAATGYISIKAADGTTYKVLVGT